MGNFVAVCPYCGKRGTMISTATGKRPMGSPRVPGMCPSHPSGKSRPHGAHWEER